MVSVRVAAIAINGRDGVGDDGDRCSSIFVDHLFPVQLMMAKKEQERAAAAAVEDDAQEQVLDFNGEIIVANIDHPCIALTTVGLRRQPRVGQHERRAGAAVFA